MRKREALILLAFALFPALALGQAAEEEILLRQLSEQGANTAFIQQAGSSNQVYLFQVDNQAATIRQEGSGNGAFLLLEGLSNEVRAIQEGEGNYYRLQLEGEGNRLSLSQKGRYNTVLQELSGARELYLILQQEGDYNRLEHREDGGSGQALPARIKQQGDGLHLIIESIYP